jgi:hypothetical protein
MFIVNDFFDRIPVIVVDDRLSILAQRTEQPRARLHPPPSRVIAMAPFGRFTSITTLRVCSDWGKPTVVASVTRNRMLRR